MERSKEIALSSAACCAGNLSPGVRNQLSDYGQDRFLLRRVSRMRLGRIKGDSEAGSR